MDLDTIYKLFIELAGFPAVLAALINIAKIFGLPDGYAPAASAIGNFVCFVGVGVLVFTGKMDILPMLDANLKVIAEIVVMLATFVTSLGMTKLFHAGLRGTPIIGYQHDK